MGMNSKSDKLIQNSKLISPTMFEFATSQIDSDYRGFGQQEHIKKISEKRGTEFLFLIFISFYLTLIIPKRLDTGYAMLSSK